MAWWREPSDPGNNWFHGPNPYNLQEPGEFLGVPGFLEPPTYHMIENVLRFRVTGGQPLTVIIYWNGHQIGIIQYNPGDNNRYSFKNLPGYGQYHIRLIDTLGRKAEAIAKLT